MHGRDTRTSRFIASSRCTTIRGSTRRWWPNAPARPADGRRTVRVLIVKTTSMGDVVHALPAVTDLHRRCPDATIDWLVEAPFAAIPALHPAVQQVLPLAWRKWRRSLWRAETRQAIANLRLRLRAQRYDLVIDLQGLVKSMLWGLQARGPLVGYDRRSIREPLAAL
ncbi:MAG: hypothetical protein HUU30_19560, partial [Burkholderiaceae bacterium]|nr:hypothetical protein [Burkholderiaceae bacterium]